MLINCVAYEQGAKLADVPVAEISDYLSKAGCFVWVALKDPSVEELDEMQQEFGLHELAVEDARHGHQRPKIEEYGESLFTVMHLVEPIPDSTDDLHVGELSVFVGRNYILSVRKGSTQGFLGVRGRTEREPELLRLGSGFVLYALMDAVVDRYFPILDMLESQLEAIESKIFTKGTARSNIEALYDLKRQVLVLKHAVAPLLEALGKIHGARVSPITSGVQEYVRDVADHLTRINSAIDSIRDTIGTAIQVNLSMVTIEEGEITKRLAAWASIFGACTAFAGIWGMNFEVMPELKWRYGYPFALVVIASVSVLLYRRFRRLGWL